MCFTFYRWMVHNCTENYFLPPVFLQLSFLPWPSLYFCLQRRVFSWPTLAQGKFLYNCFFFLSCLFFLAKNVENQAMAWWKLVSFVCKSSHEQICFGLCNFFWLIVGWILPWLCPSAFLLVGHFYWFIITIFFSSCPRTWKTFAPMLWPSLSFQFSQLGSLGSWSGSQRESQGQGEHQAALVNIQFHFLTRMLLKVSCYGWLLCLCFFWSWGWRWRQRLFFFFSWPRTWETCAPTSNVGRFKAGTSNSRSRPIFFFFLANLGPVIHAIVSRGFQRRRVQSRHEHEDEDKDKVPKSKQKQFFFLLFFLAKDLGNPLPT